MMILILKTSSVNSLKVLTTWVPFCLFYSQEWAELMHFQVGRRNSTLASEKDHPSPNIHILGKRTVVFFSLGIKLVPSSRS
jgi:hypothetical protein